MNWKNHLKYGVVLTSLLAIGLFLGTSWFNPLNFEILASMVLIIIVSPLLPDVDHPISKINQILTITGILLMISGVMLYFTTESYKYLNVFIIVGMIIVSVTFINAKYSKHRGIWHSLTITLIYGLLVCFLTKNIGLGILASFGYYTHLLCDKIPFKVF